MKTLIVIGGGPAGITAALEAAALGAAVTLVSAEPVGGRANWHSLVPSKVYLTAADALEDAQRLPRAGLTVRLLPRAGSAGLAGADCHASTRLESISAGATANPRREPSFR